MTPREIFNRVKAHLLAQKVQSTIINICAYRGRGGAKCAIGCLISDEAYSAALEGHLVGSDCVQDALIESGIELTTGITGLLSHLQSLHDCFGPHEWRDALDGVELNLNKGVYG